MKLSLGHTLLLWPTLAALALTPAARAWQLGDLNCDGDLNGFDIDPFVLALTSGPTYEDYYAEYPDCDHMLADINLDGAVDGFDIDPFVALLVSGGVVKTELAGNPLDQYPYFEYVRAFNEDAPISVAIDPTRFPAIVGQTGDIYVVAAKTELEWGTDPALVDVRPGGLQTETFVAGTIQDNTFTIAGPYELDADAGLGLGVGYDVVLDFNQNGILDGGDYIDGRGDAAGLYAVHDVTQAGPLAVTEIIYSGGAWLGQDTYYPTDVAALGQMPLVVVSHGNGHNYQWYDHIGYHMASYGYVVMSHQNNTGPGVFTASTTTLTNTDYFLGHLDTIADGVLEGHVDGSRITWIGHSRGGEGVVIAYDRIYDEEYTPENYDLDDIVLISSMLPVDFTGPSQANPHGVNYHLWTAMGDADVSSGTYRLFERGTGFRQSTSVQGSGHGDFHDGSGGAWFSGPCHIEPRERVHDIMLGYFLPLIKFYVDGNIPAKDFLWRQWEHFKPIGAPEGPICDVTGGDTVVVTNEFRQAEDSGSFIIDDYQTQPGYGTSSSGGAVTYTVSNVHEDLLRDQDGTYTWSPSDPMNGFDRARTSDSTRGGVFDWPAPSFYEYEIVPAGRDFSAYEYLSFRACQQTRHPYTTAVIEDLTFTVTLRDGSGTTSSINLGAYGGGIEEPYQRSGGWHNEMETIRVRLTDFLHNGSNLDLTDIAALRFEFGVGFGSDQGRIGLDSVEVTPDPGPPFVGPISIKLLEAVPDLIPPGVPTTFTVRISASGESYVPGSGMFNYRLDGGAFQAVPLVPVGDDLFEATLPALGCDDLPEFYFSAAGDITGPVFLPAGAPDEVFSAAVGERVILLLDTFETDMGWTTEVLGATSGFWERGVPVDDDGWDYDPASDSDDDGDQCYLTQNDYGNTDVDDGAVRLTSPTLDMSHPDFVLGYEYFLRLTDDDGNDRLLVEINADDGVGAWTEIARHDLDGGLSWHHFEITRATIEAAGVIPTATTKVRFTANDADAQSIVEGGLDAFMIFFLKCE